MGFDGCQTVIVNGECHIVYYGFNEDIDTTELDDFIRGIDENSGRIYLASQFCEGEDGYVTSRGGRDVWTFYFCQGWLTPVNEDVDTTELDDYFGEWGE